MVSLHIETARFKWVGHKNELCFFWDTLLENHNDDILQRFHKLNLVCKAFLSHLIKVFWYVDSLLCSSEGPRMTKLEEELILIFDNLPIDLLL